MVNIAVLIPHYNNIKSLEKSLESVTNIEPVDVVIIDDGSFEKPDSMYFKNKFKQTNNIHIIYFRINRGIEYALNEGLKYIKEKKYKYVARLDCGDICHPERFKIQKEFLEKYPDIFLVGSWVSFIDTNGKELFVIRYPIKHEEIKRKMFINNMFSHPAVMFRIAAIEKVGYYPIKFKHAEDYAYFFKFVKFFKTANIDKILVKVELNPEGISLSKRNQQLKSRIKIILDNWEFHYSITATIGILRSSISLLLGRKILENIKQIIYK